MVGLLLAASATASPTEDLWVARFSTAESGGLPEDWREHRFPGIEAATRYELVDIDDRTALKAHSRGSASALVRRLDAHSGLLSCLEWSWRVDEPVVTTHFDGKNADDFAARLFVVFERPRGFFSRVTGLFARAAGAFDGRALNYVWADGVPADELAPSPRSDEVITIAVQSGSDDAGTWVHHRRDVATDYRNAFGESPGKIAGIAVMSDTDDTGTSAVAYYGDIVLRAGGARPDPESRDREPPVAAGTRADSRIRAALAKFLFRESEDRVSSASAVRLKRHSTMARAAGVSDRGQRPASAPEGLPFAAEHRRSRAFEELAAEPGARGNGKLGHADETPHDLDAGVAGDELRVVRHTVFARSPEELPRVRQALARRSQVSERDPDVDLRTAVERELRVDHTQLRPVPEPAPGKVVAVDETGAVVEVAPAESVDLFEAGPIGGETARRFGESDLEPIEVEPVVGRERDDEEVSVVEGSHLAIGEARVGCRAARRVQRAQVGAELRRLPPLEDVAAME